jgi:uncharacterized membrane protein
MSRGVEILVAAFENEAAADAAYNQLKRGDNRAWLDDVAIIVHEGNKVKFKESKDMGGGKGAAIGGALGALTGLLFPPAFLVVTAAGALIGGISAKLHDANLPSDTLRSLGEQLAPGSAAIVAIVDEGLVSQATDALKRLNAKVSTVGLDADTVSRLQQASGEASAGDAPAAPAAPAA